MSAALCAQPPAKIRAPSLINPSSERSTIPWSVNSRWAMPASRADARIRRNTSGSGADLGLPHQHRTKSTIRSRVSCGTQTPVRVPQLFFLRHHAPPSVRPRLHPSSKSSSPDTRFVPALADGWSVLSTGKPPLRSRRTPSASGRTPSAEVRVRHTDPRSALLPPSASSEWRPSLPVSSASVAFSCVRSVILTDERSLHFQLRQDTGMMSERKSS
jgi:hypothetical protein